MTPLDKPAQAYSRGYDDGEAGKQPAKIGEYQSEYDSGYRDGSKAKAKKK